jgi:arylsulfatase A-like enzyme
MDVLKEQDAHTFALFPDGGVAKKQDIFGPLDEVHIYDGRSEKAVEIAIKELQVKRDSPLFMWVHLVDPHHPYDPVPEDRQFGTNDIDLYDAEILAMDRAFGMFMTAVDEHIGKENCVVAVTGDHGEAFGEHGVFFHKSGLHEEQLRVPFLIRAPSMHPQTILEPISHVDMIPTAFALAGWPLPLGDGQVLASQPASQRPVFAFHDKRGIAVRKGQFKLILSHQFGSLQVFDLDADPNERENLAPTHPDTTAELEDLILSFDVGRGGYFARLYGETPIVESARKHANSDDESTRHFAAFILRSRGLRE